MTLLCAAVMDGTEEILKKDSLHMVVIIKDEIHCEFGVASNAEDDLLPMLLLTLMRVVGGKEPALGLLEALKNCPLPPGDT